MHQCCHARIDGHPAVALDRTAFYPTGGGQPCDTGTLNGVPVVDVRDDGDLVWHLLAGPLPPGGAVCMARSTGRAAGITCRTTAASTSCRSPSSRRTMR